MAAGPRTGDGTSVKPGEIPRAPGRESLDAATLVNPLYVAELTAM
jgi:hypothetical protein